MAEKTYQRVSRCLSLADANRLWLDLCKVRGAFGEPKMYARKKYGRGWAIYEVIRESLEPSETA